MTGARDELAAGVVEVAGEDVDAFLHVGHVALAGHEQHGHGQARRPVGVLRDRVRRLLGLPGGELDLDPVPVRRGDPFARLRRRVRQRPGVDHRPHRRVDVAALQRLLLGLPDRGQALGLLDVFDRRGHERQRAHAAGGGHGRPGARLVEGKLPGTLRQPVQRATTSASRVP
jgi:hypothetical protein